MQMARVANKEIIPTMKLWWREVRLSLI